MWWLYQAVMAAALALTSPLLLGPGRGRHYRATLRGRLGGGPAGRNPPGALWLHAVSVGEVGVAATLAAALPPDLPLLVSTITPTGQARAQALLGHRADIAYLPFDLGFALRRFGRRHQPGALVLVEGDFWPLALRWAGRRGLPIAVVNGRISDRAFRRQRPWRRWLRPLFGPVGRFGVQTEEDRERFAALGVPDERIEVTGNLKFETGPPRPVPEAEARVAAAAGGRPVLVAGSTMRGEEEAILDAFAAAGGGRRALLLLAPRHPERFAAVAEAAAGRPLRVERRTQPAPPAGHGLPDVLLLDSLGELAALYGLARGAFIGGTLVATGGHNPLEAARFGVAIAAGPSMENFREIATAFDRAAGWIRVDSPRSLGAAFAAWLDDPAAAAALGERGRGVLESRQGALGRTVRLLQPLVAATRRSARAEDPA